MVSYRSFRRISAIFPESTATPAGSFVRLTFSTFTGQSVAAAPETIDDVCACPQPVTIIKKKVMQRNPASHHL
jgi:hypothetical protein